MGATVDSALRVRMAAAADAASIARLSAELGEAITPATARERTILLRGPEHEIVVAVRRPQGVVGWAEVRIEEGLTTGRNGRVLALVVTSDARRLGAGRALMEFCQRWARMRGCRELHLASGVHLGEAHAFLSACGWTLEGTECVFACRTGRTTRGRV